jgi:ADP-ribose pyrophosphatase YjhB (NUDIX family)
VEAREPASAKDVLDVDLQGGGGWCFDNCHGGILRGGLRLRGDNSLEKSTTELRARHEALAVVLQVREHELQVLLWQRAREPFAEAWALPGGLLGPHETLEHSIRLHLAAKVDVREVAHLEQIGTLSDPGRDPRVRTIATAYLGLVPAHVDPRVPEDTAWHPVNQLPVTAFDHGAIALAGRERLRAKLSYTNIGFALAPPSFTVSELRDIYRAALGHDVSATNLQRVLVRRRLLEQTGETRPPGRTGGRPAAVFRFAASDLQVTDQFAVLRPPGER